MKRVISFLFIGALFLSVFACSGAKENKEAENNATQENIEAEAVSNESETDVTEDDEVEVIPTEENKVEE